MTDWVSRTSGRRSRRTRSAMHRQMKSANCIQDLHSNDLTMYIYFIPNSLLILQPKITLQCLSCHVVILFILFFFSIDMHCRVRSAIAEDDWSGYSFRHLQTKASKFKATWSTFISSVCRFHQGQSRYSAAELGSPWHTCTPKTKRPIPLKISNKQIPVRWEVSS